MDGGSTIGVPNASIALPNIPQSPCSEAQSASERRGRVARGSGRRRIILEGALVHRARVGAGEALGAWAGSRERRGLIGRGREADGGEGQAAALSVDGGGGDGTWVGLRALLPSALSTKQILESLAGDRRPTSISSIRGR